MTRPICPKCERRYSVIGTRVHDEFRTRYLGCRKCKHRCDCPEVVPLSEAPKQSRCGYPYSNIPRTSSGRFARSL